METEGRAKAEGLVGGSPLSKSALQAGFYRCGALTSRLYSAHLLAVHELDAQQVLQER